MRACPEEAVGLGKPSISAQTKRQHNQPPSQPSKRARVEDIPEDWGLESTPESTLVESKPPEMWTLWWSQLPQRTTGRVRKPAQSLPTELSFEMAAKVQIAKSASEQTGVSWAPQKPVSPQKLQVGPRPIPLRLTWENPDPPPLYLRWEGPKDSQHPAPSLGISEQNSKLEHLKPSQEPRLIVSIPSLKNLPRTLQPHAPAFKTRKTS